MDVTTSGATKSLEAATSPDGEWEHSPVLAADVPVSRTLRRFLDQMAEDPSRALANRRRRTPAFCRKVFDLSDANALECDRTALERPVLVLGPARIAVELAVRSGDRHLVNDSLGVLAHAHLAVEQTEEGWSVLQGYREQASRCCGPCKARWLRRHGDYLVEVRDGERAHRSLSDSLRGADSHDEAGRVSFVHGISHYYLGRREEALDAELRALESLELSSPRGYFIDAISFLGVFLRGAREDHDKQAMGHLGRVRKRLKDVRDWSVVRHRLRWLEGQLFARLGDMRAAVERLDSVRRVLLASGPLRLAVAVTLDLALIYCRHSWGDNFRTAKRMLDACLRRLPAEATGEEAMLRQGLECLVQLLDRNPEHAFDAIVALRSSFVVPIPGLVSERLPTSRGIVLSGGP